MDYLSSMRDKLSHPAVRDVFVTHTVCVLDRDWPQLRVVSIAPLIAGAVRRFLAMARLAICIETTAWWRPHRKDER
jgi:phosphoribosylpyrophosphate synthetase